MRGHLQSRDRDSGHTIRSAIAENPMLHANFPMTFIYELDPYSLRARRYTGCANMNFLRQDFRKLSSDRQTRPKLYRPTTPLRGWPVQSIFGGFTYNFTSIRFGFTSIGDNKHLISSLSAFIATKGIICENRLQNYKSYKYYYY